MMFDRSLVTSGFDTETLVSEQYLTFLLLAQIEAGLLDLEFDVVDLPGTNMSVTLHPPTYKTEYPQGMELPLAFEDSFAVELMEGEDSGIVDLAFSPDGTRLLTRSLDSFVRTWDLATRTQDDTLAFEVDPAIGSAFNSSATLIATASADHKLRIWDIAARAEVRPFIGHTRVVECVAFSPDSLRLVSGSFDSTARIWDVASGASLLTLTGHVGRVICVAFDQAGTRVATGCEDGLVRVWNAQDGTLLQTLTGHTGPINCVAFSQNDLRLASGSDDNTLKLWDLPTGTLARSYPHDDRVICVAFGANSNRLMSGSHDKKMRLWSTASNQPLMTNADHRSAVTRACFFGTTPRVATASAGGSIRTFDVFQSPLQIIELRRDFMHVRVRVTIVDHTDKNNDGMPDEKVTEGPMGLIVYIALNADIAANGLETNHRLRVSFARFDEATLLALSVGQQNIPQLEATMRKAIDRDLPLGIAQGQQVQQVRMRKFFDGESATLGFYVDLGLRQGPGNDFREPRGLTGLAQNFRTEGKDIAFATSPGLFALLGPDAKFQRAERTSSGFTYPLRKDPADSSSDRIGNIDGISVGPEMIPGGSTNPPHPSGRLMVNVDATYTDAPVDVGIDVQMFFRPKRNADRIVEMQAALDVDFGLLATLLIVLGGLLVLAIPMAPVGVAFWLIAGSMVSLLGSAVAEHYASKMLAEEVDEESQASVVDALPFRLPAAARRWDPFYSTEHQIVSKLDEDVIIDAKGIAFEGSELTLDRQPQVRADIAPVDEARDFNGVTAVRYEVPDFQTFSVDILEGVGPGADRMAFLREDPVGQPNIITLTVEEVLERKAQKRMLAPIVLDARRIFLDGGQIDQLLCCTWRERTAERNRLVNEFRSRRHDEIEAEVRAEFAADGNSHTEEEITEEVDRRFLDAITDEQKEYEGGAMRDDLHAALAPKLRFDVAPEELVKLQELGVFSLEGKEIIVRKNANGVVTPYFRDHPDGDRRDNLLSLPHYSFPYAP